MSVALEKHSSEDCTNQFILLVRSYKFHIQQCKICYRKGVQNSDDLCTKTEWPSSMHKLHCRHARKNWPVTWFPLPSMLFRRGDFACQWSCKQAQLQDLGQSESTCHMWFGERQPQSERVNWLNARQVDEPFFFSEKTVTGCSYLVMLELYALPKLPP
jgi:hypothetical protein